MSGLLVFRKKMQKNALKVYDKSEKKVYTCSRNQNLLSNPINNQKSWQ